MPSLHKAKHRGESRSRKAAKTMTKTAVLTGVAAVPVVGLSSPADAATTDTWEKLAQCESSGDWQINTGNGFYGGLQFTPSTWEGFGGTEYASRADLATKTQQIQVAERVLRVQGWGAWPACSAKLGLSDADKSGGGNHDREQAEDRPARSSDRTDSADSESESAKSPDERKAAPGSKYTIKVGDTLGEIAAEHNVEGGWKELWELNRSLVGSNPNLIFPGEKLRLA